jgi:hypothetical protein
VRIRLSARDIVWKFVRVQNHVTNIKCGVPTSKVRIARGNIVET